MQGVYSRNILDKSNKNELIFSLKPFNDDRMNLNVGASQINYESGAPARSQLNFSTKSNFNFLLFMQFFSPSPQEIN